MAPVLLSPGAPQESVTFRDVAVNFTQDKWIYLDTFQKEFYRDVMLEKCNTLVSRDLHFPSHMSSASWREGKHHGFQRQTYQGVAMQVLEMQWPDPDCPQNWTWGPDKGEDAVPWQLNSQNGMKLVCT